MESGILEEQEDIRQALMNYYRVTERFAADPSLTDLSELSSVAAGQELAEVKQDIAGYRKRGIVSRSRFIIRDLKIEEPKVDNQQKMTTVVTYCLDRSKVKMIDVKTGKQVNQKPLPPIRVRSIMEYKGEWAIVKLTTRRESC